MSKQLLTVLYQGFAEWEVVFPLFCLHPAIGARYVTLGENRLRGAMGFEIKGDWSLENVNPREFDGIYLPGGLDPKTNQFPRSLGEHEQLLKLLCEFAEQDKAVAAICGAPLVLGAAGLLDGKRFACDVTEDTRGWFDKGTRVRGTWTIDGHILTGSLRGLVPFSVALARLLDEEETACEIVEFLDLDLERSER